MEITSPIIEEIKSRRSIFPKEFEEGSEIKIEIIHTLMEAALSAPSHKKTFPWRFHIYHTPEGREQLQHILTSSKATQSDILSEQKLSKMTKNIRLSKVIILLGCKYSGKVPEWEETASLASAVENIWVSLRSYQLGGYWSSPSFLVESESFLPDGEKCLGLFYIGHFKYNELIDKQIPAVSDHCIFK